MPQTCPRCHSPGRLPGQPACSSCGAPVLVPMGVLNGPRLSGHFEGGALQEFALGARTSLGRHPGNVLRLGDREVSKEHAVIEQRGPQFVVRDLGSSNGTFVNGKRILEHVLREGDELVLGASRFLFRAGQPEGAARGVTVVAGPQQQPAILALLEPEREDGFRPADQILDVAALRQDYEKLRIAHEFQRQTGTERDARALLEKILNASFELVPADNGVLFLHDPERGLTPAAVKRRDARQTGDVMLSETLLQQVMDTRRAVLTADAIIDARFSGAESIVAQGIRSAMAVPLLSGNALRGVLFVDSRERINAFNEKDLKLLAGLAGHAAIALENVELAGKIEREAVTRAELSRFLSPAVAEMVVQGRVELLRQGRLEEVSVLFADIRGFTSMAEHDAPQEVVAMLNAFFSRMADVVFRHEGNLDKFIGDCVMAVWGPPSSHPDDAARALRAGLEMQQEVELLNLRRAEEGKPPLEVGVGINTGLAVVGYMGSAERHEFTAIGDSVNTASRLCGLAKGGEVIATDATLSRAGGGFEVEPLPAVNVKGKERGISAFRVLGHEGTSVGLP